MTGASGTPMAKSAAISGMLALRLPAGHHGRGTTWLAIRPEAWRIYDAPAANRLEARVARASYLGDHVEYRLATPVGEVFAVDADVARLRGPEDVVWLDVTSRGMILVDD
ncbi:MAG: TOBE domain-containing protein [Alphaproteobacteria bacterium]